MNFPSYKVISRSELTLYPRNTRTHTDHQVGQIAASITEFGFTNPILIDEHSGIIAGEGRYLAAGILEIPNVPVIVLSDLTEAQKRAYVIADNKLALNAGWDDELLKLELSALDKINFDLSLIGFDSSEIANIFGNVVHDLGAEWEGMPEFDQNDQTSYKKCIVHFDNEIDRTRFFEAIGQSFTEKTSSVWFPPQESMDTKTRRYKDE